MNGYMIMNKNLHPFIKSLEQIEKSLSKKKKKLIRPEQNPIELYPKKYEPNRGMTL